MSDNLRDLRDSWARTLLKSCKDEFYERLREGQLWFPQQSLIWFGPEDFSVGTRMTPPNGINDEEARNLTKHLTFIIYGILQEMEWATSMFSFEPGKDDENHMKWKWTRKPDVLDTWLKKVDFDLTDFWGHISQHCISACERSHSIPVKKSGEYLKELKIAASLKLESLKHRLGSLWTKPPTDSNHEVSIMPTFEILFWNAMLEARNTQDSTQNPDLGHRVTKHFAQCCASRNSPLVPDPLPILERYGRNFSTMWRPRCVSSLIDPESKVIWTGSTKPAVQPSSERLRMLSRFTTLLRLGPYFKVAIDDLSRSFHSDVVRPIQNESDPSLSLHDLQNTFKAKHQEELRRFPSRTGSEVFQSTAREDPKMPIKRPCVQCLFLWSDWDMVDAPDPETVFEQRGGELMKGRWRSDKDEVSYCAETVSVAPFFTATEGKLDFLVPGGGCNKFHATNSYSTLFGELTKKKTEAKKKEKEENKRREENRMSEGDEQEKGSEQRGGHAQKEGNKGKEQHPKTPSKNLRKQIKFVIGELRKCNGRTAVQELGNPNEEQANQNQPGGFKKEAEDLKKEVEEFLKKANSSVLSGS